ncbi:hypothetical protein SAMD00019534_086380 [Acytostelium subglobosum LB1]|uniref:hypothetical protein n=1 Tax=Acytostelium subglobosum LB1 TaxID=1410327 RepID=UPI000644AA5F|nr:hypothetical protein SAMD00019534_086380 [Acytostelium subglobosum LB1]GAM25463.1 hypothetical protein SAMD00019534_086380 [Acytostelium subglobosum LB1]|eukprot:XP_012751449.1 hypothetical protein SAMD00019534_086380 [Acytostelium subglobosum LB1]
MINIDFEIWLVLRFEDDYQCGTFVNGDYWVTPKTNGGHVIITSIDPPFNGSIHGWQVNPWNDPALLDQPQQQSFDYSIYDFNASLAPALPYAASPSSSIVKAISQLDENRCTAHYGCLLTASVLTVLAQPPPKDSFRPNYYGPNKLFYSADKLQTNFMIKIDMPSVDQTPTLQYMEERFQRVYLDHISYSSSMHPSLNMATYGADIVSDTGDAVLRLMMNETLDQKWKLLINYIQVGIDFAGMFKQGITWPANGGINSGRMLPIVFASVLLGDHALAKELASKPPNTFGEDGQVYWSVNASRPLWGRECDDNGYWYNQLNADRPGGRDCRDPFGYIDGGETPGGSYQACCTTMAWKSTALSLRLMPQLQCTFNFDPFLNYVDRYVSYGTWTLPDPISLQASGGVPGPPRYGQLNGTSVNFGFYVSDFSNNMWTQYREAFGTNLSSSNLKFNDQIGSSFPQFIP